MRRVGDVVVANESGVTAAALISPAASAESISSSNQEQAENLWEVYSVALFKRAFPDQALALPIGPFGVLFGNRRGAGHGAVAPFPTQPPQEPPLQ